MSFSDLQVRRLRAKLEARRVKSRSHHGRELSYVEGWYVMAEANRIFGFDGWDRLSHSQQLLYERRDGDTFEVAYLARVRVIVRAGAGSVVREGSGFGSASNAHAGEAHELALKAAETDATKRALATFGNRFGLSLYDKDQAGVAKPSQGTRGSNGAGDAGNGKAGPASVPVALQHEHVRGHAPAPLRSTLNDAADSFVEHTEDSKGPEGLHTALVFLKALRERLRRALSVHELDEILARSSVELERVRDTHPDLRDRRGAHMVDVVASIVALKRQELENGVGNVSARRGAKVPALNLAIDKSRLALATVKRYRDKDHLRRVAGLPCLICGRVPAQAHHLRFAQARGMGLKVSDEFTVPLCAIDHDALHRSGDERAWWTGKQVDPLPMARSLWAQSRDGVARPPEASPPLEGKPA